MNKLLVSIIVVLSLIGCVSALDGTTSQYSQYYIMPPGPAASSHIIAPEQFQISGSAPATVYFKDQQQAMPYDQYLSYSAYMGGNSLWIRGSTSWTQYAQVPQGAFLSLIATSTTGGNGYLNEIYPDGKVVKNNYYYFAGYNRIGFTADTVGQHILLFVIDGKVSNAIVIDVTGYQAPVYQQPVNSQPTYVSPIYYREIAVPEPIILVNPWKHIENPPRDEDWHGHHPPRGNTSPTET
ncbi:MAG: hypothetical protein EHM14_03845 [Methanothrix sp.]|nr:MAG: hypothetical protein EHM14_03845 [Methanothrix sp.]